MQVLSLFLLLVSNSQMWVPFGTGQERLRVDIIEESNSGFVAELTVPTLIGKEVIEHGRKFLDIITPNCGWITEPGAPQLPLVARLFALPGNQGAKVEILDYDVETYSIPSPVLPYQGPIYRNGTRKYPQFQYNESIYSLDSYPQVSVRIGDVSIVRDLRIAPLIFYPVVYHPGESKITVYRRIRVKVTFEGTGENPRMRLSNYITRSYRQIFKHLLINYESIVKPLITTDGSILIITHDNFISQAESLANYKRSLGYEVVVTPLSDIGLNPTANDIKDYIQNAYNTWEYPPEYIILVGDAQFMPYFSTSLVDPTDHPYTELEGNDYLPDAHLARISVQTQDEANYVILHKTLNYESNPDVSSTSWFLSGTGISGSDYVDDQNAARCGQLAHDFGGFTHWDSLYQSLGTNTVMNVRNAINEGRSWIAYFGHGYETGWGSTVPDFENQNIYQLTNGMKLPVIVDIACSNGDFTYSSDCFAEAWLKAGSEGSEKGAINLVASTIVCAFFYTDTLGRGTYIGYFQDSIWAFGAAVDFGKLYMYQYFPEPPGGTCEETIQNHEVFNDPHMDPWSDVPTNLTVLHPDSIPWGPSTVSIGVVRNGIPAKEALVAFLQDSVLIGRGYTDESGNAVVNVNPQLPLPIIMRVSYHNSYTYVDTILVEINQPYVTIASLSFDDGGANGEINPGEVIQLNLWVKNLGNQIASGVTGFLSTEDSLLTILDSLEVIGDIAPGDSVLLTHAFEIMPDSNTPDMHSLILDFQFTSSQGDTWTSARSLNVLAPVLIIHDYRIVDTAGSPVIDPGEDALIVLNLKNTGHSISSQIVATITSTDTFVQIIDSTAYFDALSPDSVSQYDTLLIHLSENTPVHQDETIYMSLSSDFMTFQDSVMFRVGVGGDFLIWEPDPTPSTGTLIRDILLQHGLVGDYTTDLTDYLDDVPYYSTIFVCVGVFSHNYIIGQNSPEAQVLESYLTEHHGRLYLEGGDVWYYDPHYENGYDFGPLFGILATDDGFGDLHFVNGETGTFTDGMSFIYGGENNYIDHILPTGNGFAILHNQSPYYQCGVANIAQGSGGEYRTVGLSFELGGLQDGQWTKEDLILAIANFFGIITGVSEESHPKPHFTFSLSPVRPNPMVNRGILQFSIPEKGHVSLFIYNESGQRVCTLVNRVLQPGIYHITWDGRNNNGMPLASGVYFIRLESSRKSATRKIVLLKNK